MVRPSEDGWFGHDAVSDAVATAIAAGGDGEWRKWREFLLDDAVQKRFATEFLRKLKDLVKVV